MNRAPPSTSRAHSASDQKRPDPKDRFHLLIDCRDEPTQRRLYEQLTAQGLKCRVLVL